MTDLHQVAAQDPEFPRVLFVHQSSVADGEAAMDPLWHEASAIADPKRELYELFSLRKGKMSDMFGLRSLQHTVRAFFKKNGIGNPKGGDVRQMPGIYLIVNEEIIWQHDYQKGIGELPDWKSMPAVVGDQ